MPRAAFTALLDTDPAAAGVVLTQVADRLRTAGGASTAGRVPAAPKVIAVIGLHAGSEASTVADVLVTRMREHLSVVVPGVVDAAGLERAEQDGDRVVLVAAGGAPSGSPEQHWQDFCLRQSDAVVLVARADQRPCTPATAPSRQPDLVLVGTAPPPPLRASGWPPPTPGR